jgi:hypothetical protein
MRYLACFMAMVFVLTMTAASFAGSEIPDLKGTWVVKGKGILLAKPSKSPPPKRHVGKLGMNEGKFLLVIEKQDGFRFTGYMESSRKKAPICGVIGFDNKTVYIVSDLGIDIGRLISPNQIESIYLEANEHYSTAARAIFTRKR